MWDLGLDNYIIGNKILISAVILEKKIVPFLALCTLGVFCRETFSTISRYTLQ